MTGRLDHIVLNVTDVDAMVHFYVDVLQLAPERLEAYRKGEVPFPSLRIHPDTIIDLFPGRLWDRAGTGRSDPPNLNHFCLALPKAEWTYPVGPSRRTRRPSGRRSGIPLGRPRHGNFHLFPRPREHPDRGQILRGSGHIGELHVGLLVPGRGLRGLRFCSSSARGGPVFHELAEK